MDPANIEVKQEEKPEKLEKLKIQKPPAISSNTNATAANTQPTSSSGNVAGSSSSAQHNTTASLPQYHITPTVQGASKYSQLLALIDELGKDIRPTYTGNRNCSERLKRGIMHARVLAKECILEVEKNARQQQQQQPQQ
uniref:Cyclin-dependent kinase 2-associated protein n=1 Tax=Ditylenchus dipsaci TaxID=166011 RepID=A0A915CNP7_9BILA